MQDERNEMNPIEDVVAQRAIVLQVLRQDHVEPWTRAELESEIYDIEPLTISDALAALDADGVVDIAGEQVRASRAAWRLDALGMVSI
jgi:DNA-binding HxlR family transcriptional regulator